MCRPCRSVPNGCVHFALVTAESTPTNQMLAVSAPAGIDGVVLSPSQAMATLGFGDVALGRLDVLESLDGVARGLSCLGALEARGVTVLNSASVLLATHDKLVTARLLHAARVPHPETRHVRVPAPPLDWIGPAVVKPRHGSWGRDVARCETAGELQELLTALQTRPWFMRHGALVQELIPPVGYDLRVLVAAGHVVGAVRRDAARHEWRTNVALGATRTPVRRPPDDARELALRAASAVNGDLVGVDLLPTPDGSWTVIEVNGAVEFDETYATDVHRRTVERLLDRVRSRRGDPDQLAVVQG